jgi:hypothetical protein
MAVSSYQLDGSCVVTRDDGAVTTIPAADQAVMDIAISNFVGPQAAPVIDDPVTSLAALLVQKGIISVKELADNTVIDAGQIAVAVAVPVGP